jgi:hypothetical protein
VKAATIERFTVAKAISACHAGASRVGGSICGLKNSEKSIDTLSRVQLKDAPNEWEISEKHLREQRNPHCKTFVSIRVHSWFKGK